MLMNRMISSLTLALILGMLAACAPMAPPQPPPMAAPPPPPAEASLYQRLGGEKALVAVVDDFVGNVAADKRIKRFFAKTNVPRLKTSLVTLICQATGGPCTYSGPSMRVAHHNRRITNAHFDALVQDLVKTLNKFNVPQHEQQELLGILGPLRSEIVNV
jgi:hemoglobin